MPAMPTTPAATPHAKPPKPVELPTLRCRRCGHKWTARVRMPVKCPRCQTLHWQQVAGRRRQRNGGGSGG